MIVVNKYSNNETYRTLPNTSPPAMTVGARACAGYRSRLQMLDAEKAKLTYLVNRDCVGRGPLDDNIPITTPSPTQGRFFDPIAYANRYVDLKKAFGYDTRALTNHWLTAGIREQRNGTGSKSCGKFNPAVYARINGLKGMDYFGIMSHYRNVGVHRRLNYC